jgi:hypothetical protein
MAISGLFLYFGGPKIVKHKYGQVKQLYQLVSTKYKPTETKNYKTILKIIWYSCVILCQALYINILQYLNNSVKKLENFSNTYEITYVLSGKTYKLIVAPKKGPKNVLQVIDDNNQDITHIIAPYLGPREDWHLSIFKPSFFNRKSMTFNLSNSDDITFGENEYIYLK